MFNQNKHFFIVVIIFLSCIVCTTSSFATLSLRNNPILNSNSSALLKAVEKYENLFKKKTQKAFIEECIKTFSQGLSADIFFTDAGVNFLTNLGKLYKYYFPDEKESSWMGLLLVHLLENKSLFKEIEQLMESEAQPIPEMAGLLQLAVLLKKATLMKDKKGRITVAKFKDGTVLQFKYYSQGMLVLSKGPDGIAKYFFNNRGLLVYREIQRPGQQKITTYYNYTYDGTGKIQMITETEYQGSNKTTTIKNRYNNIIEKYKNGIKIFETGFNQKSYFETAYTDEGVIASTVRFKQRPLSFLQWVKKMKILDTANWDWLQKQHDKYKKKLKQSESKYDSAGDLYSKEYFQHGETIRKETYHTDGSINRVTFYKNNQPDFELDYSSDGLLVGRTEFKWDSFFEESFPKQKFLFNLDGTIKCSIEYSAGRKKKSVDADGTLTTFEYFSDKKSSPLFRVISKQIVIAPDGKKTVTFYNKYQSIIKEETSTVEDHIKSTLAEPKNKRATVPIGIKLMIQQQQKTSAATVSNQKIGLSKPGLPIPKKQF